MKSRSARRDMREQDSNVSGPSSSAIVRGAGLGGEEVRRDDQRRAEACEKLRFADFELDLDALELCHRGIKVAVQRKPLEVLAELVRRCDRTVAKAELLERVWPGVRVSEHALTSAIRDLRRALGDSESPHRIVITDRGRGFRFVAPVAEERISRRISSDEEQPFVDREEVMGRLLSGLRASMAGNLHVTFLAGPAGIGKTRAALELIREARGLQVEIHSGRCYAGDGATPFWPWLHIVRNSVDRARSIPSLERVIQHVAWIAPELARDHAPEAHGDLDRAEARFRLFDAVGHLLRTLSEQRAVLVVIEDLHWADDASLLLLDFLSQSLVGARIHFVVTFRDTEVGADHPLTTVLGAAAGRPSTERIDLVGLRRESVGELLKDDCGQEPTPSFLDRAFQATGGNPFFVTELVGLVARGEIDPTAPDSEVPLPARVRDAVRLRLRARSDGCNRLLTVASVIGRELEAAPLARACGLSHGDTLDLLDEAVSAALLSRVAGRKDRYFFVHDLVRETLYREMGASERVRTHRQMAEALEELADASERLGEIAYHYAEAAADGVAEKAVRYSMSAAERAGALMAFEDVVRHYERALYALTLVASPDPELRCRLLVLQAAAAWGTLEHAERVQNRFIRAADAARAIGSAELLARAALGRTGYGAGPGDYRDISLTDHVDIGLLREANRALGDRPTVLKALVMARLALALQLDRDRSFREKLAADAVRIAGEVGDRETLACVLRYRHEVISDPAHLRERLALAKQILELAREVKSRPLELDALTFLSRDHFELGEIAETVEAGHSAEALAATMRHPGALFQSGIREVLILTMRGFFGEAEDKARRYFERDQARNLAAEGTFAAQSVTILRHSGRHLEAIAILERETRCRPAVGLTRYFLALEYVAVGRIEHAKGELERAAQAHFGGVARDHNFLGSLMILAELCFELDDRPRGEELYRLALPFEHAIAAPHLVTTCFGAVARALGVLAHLTRNYDAAELHFERAVALERAIRARSLLALTLERFARMLIGRGSAGDHDRALVLTREAESIAERCGMTRTVQLTKSLRAQSVVPATSSSATQV